MRTRSRVEGQGKAGYVVVVLEAPVKVDRQESFLRFLYRRAGGDGWELNASNLEAERMTHHSSTTTPRRKMYRALRPCSIEMNTVRHERIILSPVSSPYHVYGYHCIDGLNRSFTHSACA